MNRVRARNRAELIEALERTLAEAAHPAGGWPYYAGKRPRVEPTCWALLALAAPGRKSRSSLLPLPHLRFLAGRQQPDGVLIDETPGLPNFTANGLAACVLSHLASTEGPALPRLLDGIVAVKGVSAQSAPDLRQDNTLQAWPWMPGTFSWVEPTAWCLLALKKTRAPERPAAESRIDEADKLIANRSCVSGGWNFGNASALGQDLRPYVPTTALALIALQDRGSDPVVARGLALLSGSRVTEPSAMALALTVLCLHVYGVPAEDVESRLVDDADRALRIGNVQALAMMLYALTAAEHGAKALRI
jgi:hypothetical protein